MGYTNGGRFYDPNSFFRDDERAIPTAICGIIGMCCGVAADSGILVIRKGVIPLIRFVITKRTK